MGAPSRCLDIKISQFYYLDIEIIFVLTAGSEGEQMTPRTSMIARRIMLGVFAAFLLVASIGPKLAGASVATEALAELGWPASASIPLGWLELACLMLVLMPRTRVFGALLMTAFLGGAVATHVRAASPLFSHVLFGAYLGALMWGAVLLEDPRLRALVLGRARS
jgi:hypothetical protein